MTVDLTTQYLGMELRNPIVVSACPLTSDLDTLVQLEAAGAAAAVLPSLFEEQIEHEAAEVARLYDFRNETKSEAASYVPEMHNYNVGPDYYLFHLQQAKKRLQIPIIASLNGVTRGGWTRYARFLEDAGADAIELNAYFVPTDAWSQPIEIEQRYIDMVAEVRAKTSIPLAVKIGPYFTNMAHTARRLVGVGAEGLVLFNRFLEPDINLESQEFVPTLVLSSRNELPLSLRWIAILHGQIDASLAASSGIHEYQDVLKTILAGADVAMLASVLMQRGTSHIESLLTGMKEWMTQKGYDSLAPLKGRLNRSNCPDASALERLNYTKAIVSYNSPESPHA